MYDVEKKVPIPSGDKYPWKDMKVGDSFATTGGREGFDKAGFASRRYGRRNGTRYCQRWEKGKGRIWRVE